MKEIVQLEKPIATGWSSDIYLWKENQVLKLYKRNIPREFVEFEIKAAQFAYDSGLATPRVVCKLKQIGRRHGICFERITGTTLLDEILANYQDCSKYMKQMAKLHVQVNSVQASGFPSNFEEIGKKIRTIKFLSVNIKKNALINLQSLSDGTQLCHGDFSPTNIMIAFNQAEYIIDWSHARYGNPYADVTRTLIIMNIFDKNMSQLYHDHYFSLSNLNSDGIEPWIPVIAVSLIYDLPKKRKELIAIAKDGYLF